MEKYFTAKYLFEYAVPIFFFGAIALIFISGYIIMKWDYHKKSKLLKKYGFEKVIRDMKFGSVLDSYDWVCGDCRISDFDVSRLEYNELEQKIKKMINKEGA